MSLKDRIMFNKLMDIKTNQLWWDMHIFATTNRDVEVTSSTEDSRIISKGTRVRVWMVSRFGDVGITDDIKIPNGYDVRGVDADTDLRDFEFKKVSTVCNLGVVDTHGNKINHINCTDE